jgi:DNA adenine methylase
MTVTQLTPPVKWPGGKHYLAAKIVELMPKHTHYVELYAGGLAVLWEKDPEGVSEVVNDLNGDLTNFYQVLQSEKLFERFVRQVPVIPFGRPQWEEAVRQVRKQADADRVTRAVCFYIQNRMSLAGRMAGFTGITKTRTRGGMNAEVYAWMGAVEDLPAIHERLSRVLIENRPAVRLMAGHDVEGVLMYADPTYPHETRTSKKVYREYEMSDDDHREFLDAAKRLRHAKILISGYRCPLYDEALRTWHRHEFDIANHAASGKTKRRMCEVLWCNY